jgi:hypothetical protein
MIKKSLTVLKDLNFRALNYEVAGRICGTLRYMLLKPKIKSNYRNRAVNLAT